MVLPDLLGVLRERVSLCKHIPEGARFQWAEGFAQILRALSDDPSEDTVRDAIWYPKYTLNAVRGGARH